MTKIKTQALFQDFLTKIKTQAFFQDFLTKIKTQALFNDMLDTLEKRGWNRKWQYTKLTKKKWHGDIVVVQDKIFTQKYKTVCSTFTILI